MVILKKQKGKDFVVLNITDPQLSDEEWAEGHTHRAILEYTLTKLVERVQPDLITISGDLAWAGNEQAYAMLGALLESFSIPWGFVWGNHDNQGGAECVDKVATSYMALEHCIYEKGDLSLGNGNYVICIQEGDKPVEAIFMMDSHDRDEYEQPSGEKKLEWGKLTAAQIDWYKDQAKFLKDAGYQDTTLILHIPIYAYRLASAAAIKEGASKGEWNIGYENSIGEQNEGVCAPPVEDGVFAAIKEIGTTKHVLAGHDHANNWVISYEGVRLAYGLKAGAGCYWQPTLNGGTLLKINENGVYAIAHEFVDVAHLLKTEN